MSTCYGEYASNHMEYEEMQDIIKEGYFSIVGYEPGNRIPDWTNIGEE